MKQYTEERAERVKKHLQKFVGEEALKGEITKHSGSRRSLPHYLIEFQDSNGYQAITIPLKWR